jgi:hypothetical protein
MVCWLDEQIIWNWQLLDENRRLPIYLLVSLITGALGGSAMTRRKGEETPDICGLGALINLWH